MSTIIFDFDGTIADSFDYVFGFLRDEARKSSEAAAADPAQFHGMSMKDMASGLGIPFWRLPFVYFKGQRVMRASMGHIKPFAGMPALLRQLHDDGHILFIVSSNSNKNIQTFLHQHDLQDCFQAVRGGAGLLGKAAPMKQLLGRADKRTQECWSIGDEVVDIVSGKVAGTKTIAVTWGFASRDELAKQSPDSIVDTPAEIAAQLTSS
jgi:phosphoglycolate phosphatase